MATVLRVLISDAASVLQTHIEQGKELLSSAEQVRDYEGSEEWSLSRSRWIKRTHAALLHIYEGEAEATEFENAAYPSVAIEDSGGWDVDLKHDCGYVQRAVNTLVSLDERLVYASEPAGTGIVEPATEAEAPAGAPVIFLVHGHTNRREEVARFLEKASRNAYEVVILDEKPGRSRALIEKLEKHTANAKYAVILFTGDDLGAAADEPKELRPRARQNVVFEFGWLCGQIGRENVAVLYERNVELPSDASGVSYISLEEADWRARLVRDLRDADLDVSMDYL